MSWVWGRQSRSHPCSQGSMEWPVLGQHSQGSTQQSQSQPTLAHGRWSWNISASPRALKFQISSSVPWELSRIKWQHTAKWRALCVFSPCRVGFPTTHSLIPKPIWVLNPLEVLFCPLLGQLIPDQGLGSSQPYPLSPRCCGSPGHKISAIFTGFDIPTCPSFHCNCQEKPAWNSEGCLTLCHLLWPRCFHVFSFSIQKSLCKIHPDLDGIVASQGSSGFAEESEPPWSAMMPSKTDTQAPVRGVSLGKKKIKIRRSNYASPAYLDDRL